MLRETVRIVSKAIVDIAYEADGDPLIAASARASFDRLKLGVCDYLAEGGLSRERAIEQTAKLFADVEKSLEASAAAEIRPLRLGSPGGESAANPAIGEIGEGGDAGETPTKKRQSKSKLANAS